LQAGAEELAWISFWLPSYWLPESEWDWRKSQTSILFRVIIH